MTTYTAQPGVHVGRPPCANCGANYHLHHEWRPPGGHDYSGPGRCHFAGDGYCDGSRGSMEHRVEMRCPTAYRPGTIEAARQALATAEASGDAARIFTARGDLQRLTGR